MPQLKRKGKDSEKLKNDSTKKLLARYLIILHNYIFNRALTMVFFYRCYLKLGCWQEELQGLTELSIPNVLEYYGAATFHDPSWYKAWHSWAYMNFETVLFYKHQQSKLQSNELTTEKILHDKGGSEVI